MVMIHIIDVLLKAHCDTNHHEKDGMAALFLSLSEWSLYNVLATLPEAGADPNSRWMNSWTPLMAASIDGYSEIVELLSVASQWRSKCLFKGRTNSIISCQSKWSLSYCRFAFTVRC